MKYNKKDNIKGIIFLVWFIVTFISIFLSQGNTYLGLILFGQAFFVFGLVAIFSMDMHDKENYFLFVFLLVGLTLIEIGFMGIFNDKYVNIMIPYSIANAITVLGLLLMLFEGEKCKKKKIIKVKTKYQGKIKIYQRSYRYNIRDFKLIKDKDIESVEIFKKEERINKKEDKFIYKIGVIFFILGIAITLFIMMTIKM